MAHLRSAMIGSSHKGPLSGLTKYTKLQNQAVIQALKKPPSNLYSETAIHSDVQELNDLKNVPNQVALGEEPTAAACSHVSRNYPAK